MNGFLGYIKKALKGEIKLGMLFFGWGLALQLVFLLSLMVIADFIPERVIGLLVLTYFSWWVFSVWSTARNFEPKLLGFLATLISIVVGVPAILVGLVAVFNLEVKM